MLISKVVILGTVRPIFFRTLVELLIQSILILLHHQINYVDIHNKFLKIDGIYHQLPKNWQMRIIFYEIVRNSGTVKTLCSFLKIS